MPFWNDDPPETFHFFAVFIDHLGQEHAIPRAIHDPGTLYPNKATCLSHIMSAWVRAATAKDPFTTPFIVREIRVTQEGS